MNITLHDGHRTYLVHDTGRLSAAPAGAALPRPSSREDAAWQLGRLFREPGSARSLRRFLAAAASLTSLADLDDQAIKQHVARLWAAGRLAIFAMPTVPLPAHDGEEEEPPPPAARPAIVAATRAVEKTWIEIELLDEAGEPVADERYRIKLTDGNTYHGRLDTWGRARYPGIDAGDCAVWFPDLDSKQWIPAAKGGEDDAPESEAPRGPRRTWVEIELLDDDGAPAAGERYEITLPSGEVFLGTLDDRGTAFHGDLDPGTCQITFPRLAPRAWEAD